MVLDGSLGYIGRADEPTRIIFKGGRIVDIEETPTGIRLKKYMEEYFDPRIAVLFVEHHIRSCRCRHMHFAG